MKDQQLQKLCSSGQSCHEGTAVSHFAPQPLANLFYLYHSLHNSLTPDDIRPDYKNTRNTELLVMIPKRRCSISEQDPVRGCWLIV